MEESEANRTYYLQLQQIWEKSRLLAADSAIDEEKAWQRFQQRIGGKANTGKVKPLQRFSSLRVAASLVILLGLAVVTFLLVNRNGGAKEIIAETKENTLVDTLPDGTVVTLNKRSSVTFPSVFKGGKRKVTLKGEAFFNVTPDKKKPFIISVNDVQVEVVGTSFNVKNGNGATEVVVETGIVKVTRAGRTVELRAGERLLLSGNETKAEKTMVGDKLYNYYRSREFVCDNTPLWKLVQVLNEAYDANIVVGRKELNELRINTTFNNESLDKILEVIHLTFDIEVERKDGQIILQ